MNWNQKVVWVNDYLMSGVASGQKSRTLAGLVCKRYGYEMVKYFACEFVKEFHNRKKPIPDEWLKRYIMQFYNTRKFEWKAILEKRRIEGERNQNQTRNSYVERDVWKQNIINNYNRLIQKKARGMDVERELSNIIGKMKHYGIDIPKEEL